MQRKRIPVDITAFPTEFHSLLCDAVLYDSSCSPNATVWLIDKDNGYYLKRSAKGSLATEAQMTRYFAQQGLSATVLNYLSAEQDWLLTTRVEGEDATHAAYLDDPKRLCDTMAECLRALHARQTADCPIQDRNARYLQTLETNYRDGVFDPSFLPPDTAFCNADEVYRYVQQHKQLLKSEVLIHGDYCLPNMLFRDFQFSGFIDLGNAGVGDRHIDLFWGAWTLQFNLHTDAYRDRFFDAYGRADVDEERIHLVGMMESFG